MKHDSWQERSWVERRNLPIMVSDTDLWTARFGADGSFAADVRQRLGQRVNGCAFITLCCGVGWAQPGAIAQWFLECVPDHCVWGRFPCLKFRLATSQLRYYCCDCNGSIAPRIVMMPISGQGLEMSLHHQSSMKDGRGRATPSRRLWRWRNPCAAIAIGVAHLARQNCYCPLGILEMVLCHVPDTWCRYLKHVSAFSFDICVLPWDVPFQVGCSKGEKESICFRCLCYGIMPVKITVFLGVRTLVVFFIRQVVKSGSSSYFQNSYLSLHFLIGSASLFAADTLRRRWPEHDVCVPRVDRAVPYSDLMSIASFPINLSSSLWWTCCDVIGQSVVSCAAMFDWAVPYSDLISVLWILFRNRCRSSYFLWQICSNRCRRYNYRLPLHRVKGKAQLSFLFFVLNSL